MKETVSVTERGRGVEVCKWNLDAGVRRLRNINENEGNRLSSS